MLLLRKLEVWRFKGASSLMWRVKMYRALMFSLFVVFGWSGENAFGKDASYFCTTPPIGGGDEPIPRRYDVRGSELIDRKAEVNEFRKRHGIEEKEEGTTYRIMLDNARGVVAVWSDAYSDLLKRNQVVVSVIMINKVTGGFSRRDMFSSKGVDEVAGFCQFGK